MPTELERDFDKAMIEIYTRARDEAHYTATRFLNMITAQGGLEAARSLLYAQGISEGYVALFMRRRLDLTMEAVILQPEWDELFTEEERDIARRRLKDYGYVSG